MIRLRICPDGPLLLSDGRRAVLEKMVPYAITSEGTPLYKEDCWQPIPIIEDET